MIRSQHRCRSKTHNVFSEQLNKIILIYNDDKRMQSIALIETYAYGTRKDLICQKEKIKRNIIKQYKQYKQYNLYCITKEHIKIHNLNWPEIPDHPY